MQDSIVNILQKRDGVSHAEAEQQWEEFQAIFNEMLSDDADLDDIEEEFMSFFGLEPDYLLEYI